MKKVLASCVMVSLLAVPMILAGLLIFSVQAQEDVGRPLVEYHVGHLEVVPPGLLIVQVVPPLTALDVGEMLQYTAIGEFSDGSTVDISDQVVWVSLNPAVATIDADTGLATGIGVGNVDIAVSLIGGS